MNPSRLALSVCLFLLLFSILPGWAQQHEGYRDFATAQVRSDKLAAPEHLRNYVAEGHLRLSLRDAIVLTLENNSSVRIQETQVELSKFSLLGAHSPFDPIVTSSYNVNSSTFPPFSQLQGTGTAPVNTTTQFAQFNYSQTFETGTNIQGVLNSNNSFSNNSFYLVNPSITSILSFQFTQPLLKNGGLLANRAPLLIARRNLEQSRATFAAQVSNNILQAVQQYWAVVEARGNLDVAQRSMDAAEVTYKRDKRALE